MTDNSEQTRPLFAQLKAKKLADQRQAYTDAFDLADRLNRLLSAHLKRNNEFFGHDPFIDPRQAAMARTHFEEGMRAMLIGLGATLQPPEGDE